MTHTHTHNTQAETISYQDLVDYGGEQGAKEKGKVGYLCMRIHKPDLLVFLVLCFLLHFVTGTILLGKS